MKNILDDDMVFHSNDMILLPYGMLVFLVNETPKFNTRIGRKPSWYEQCKELIRGMRAYLKHPKQVSDNVFKYMREHG